MDRDLHFRLLCEIADSHLQNGVVFLSKQSRVQFNRTSVNAPWNIDDAGSVSKVSGELQLWHGASRFKCSLYSSFCCQMHHKNNENSTFLFLMHHVLFLNWDTGTLCVILLLLRTEGKLFLAESVVIWYLKGEDVQMDVEWTSFNSGGSEQTEHWKFYIINMYP